MRTRTETVVSIYKAWAASDANNREIDIILPQDATDWFVTEYDGN